MFLTTFLAALLVGTLVEYLGHRGMHEWGFFSDWHYGHHKRNTANNWFADAFLLYFPLVSPLFLLCYWLGWGWAAGGVVYLLVFSWCHQQQHNRPDRVWWMRLPLHHIHHRHYKGRANYGVVTDFWDKVFRTYKLPEHWRN